MALRSLNGINNLRLPEMKKSIFLLVTIMAAFQAKAVSYLFDCNGATYDLVDYLDPDHSKAFLTDIQPEGIKGGVFHLPTIASEDSEAQYPVAEVRLYAVPEAVKAFSVDRDNPYFTTVDGVLYSKDMTRLVAVPHAKMATFTIPPTVKVIGYGAFATGPLTQITIPEGVTTIEPYAFARCPRLASVTCPATVTAVSGTAFEDTPFEAALTGGMNYLGRVAFRYAGTMPKGYTLHIKDGTVAIADRAVKDNPNLVELDVPRSVTCIGEEAFSGCLNLRRVATLSSDCVIRFEAFPTEVNTCDFVFEGDKSRYFMPGDNIVHTAGMSMVRGVDTPPLMCAVLEANKFLTESEKAYDATLASITINDGGITLYDVEAADEPSTFGIAFGHEGNVTYSLSSTYYKRAREAARDVSGVYYVRFRVTAAGEVKDIAVTMPTTFKPNNAAVVRLIEALPPFVPATRHGKPVDAWVNVYVVTEPIAGGFLYDFPV